MKLINTRQAADILGVTRERIRQLVEEGKLEPAAPVQPRQTMVFFKDDIKRLKEERER